jgi:hypothetical protein
MSNWQGVYENRSRGDQWGDQWYQGTAVADSSVDQNPGGGVQKPPRRAASLPASLPAVCPPVAAAKANPAASAFGNAYCHCGKTVARKKAKAQPKAKATAKGDPTAVDDAALEVLSVTAVADAGTHVMIGNQTAVADAGAPSEQPPSDAGETPAPTENSSDSQAVYCEDCEMWLNGPTQWEDHKIGKKHRKNLKRSKGANAAGNDRATTHPEKKM